MGDHRERYLKFVEIRRDRVISHVCLMEIKVATQRILPFIFYVCVLSVAFERLCANVLEKIEINLHRYNQSGAVASIIIKKFELPRISKVLPYVIMVLIGTL